MHAYIVVPTIANAIGAREDRTHDEAVFQPLWRAEGNGQYLRNSKCHGS